MSTAAIKNIKVAFWNATLGPTSFDYKLDVFCEWVMKMEPHFLFLEELGAEYAQGGIDQLLATKKYNLIRIAEQYIAHDKNDREIPKCLALMVHQDADFLVKAHGIEAFPKYLDYLKEYQKKKKPQVNRDSIYLQLTNGFEIWGVHANSSDSGGAAMVAAVNEYLHDYQNVIVGGDFNCRFAECQGIMGNGFIVIPKDWSGRELTFTQFSDTHSFSHCDPAELHLQTLKLSKDNLLKPNYLIDYIIHNSDLDIAALANTFNEESWLEILIHFDHCPIMYSIPNS